MQALIPSRVLSASQHGNGAACAQQGDTLSVSRQLTAQAKRGSSLGAYSSRVHRQPPYRRSPVTRGFPVAQLTTALCLLGAAANPPSRMYAGDAPFQSQQHHLVTGALDLAAYTRFTSSGIQGVISSGLQSSESSPLYSAAPRKSRQKGTHGASQTYVDRSRVSVGCMWDPMQGSGCLQPNGDMIQSYRGDAAREAVQDDASPLSSSSAFPWQAVITPPDVDDASSALVSAGSKRSWQSTIGTRLTQQQPLIKPHQPQPQQYAVLDRRVLRAARSVQQPSQQQQQQQQLPQSFSGAGSLCHWPIQQFARHTAAATSTAAAAGVTAAMAAGLLCTGVSERAAALHTQNREQALPPMQSSLSHTASSFKSQPGALVNAMQQQQQQQQSSFVKLQQLQLLKNKQQQQQQQILLAASRVAQQQQHQQHAQQLLQRVLAIRGSSSSTRVTATTASSISATIALATAIPRPNISSQQYSLLTWAGGILTCTCHSAYQLAHSMWQRVDGRMDELLLLSMGVSVPSGQAGMLITLWIASKLEGQRRQVAGTSRLATTLQLLPWAVTNLELHVMQLLEWRPYAHLPAAAA